MHAYGNLQVNPAAVVDDCHGSTSLKAADAQRTHLICLGIANGSTVKQEMQSYGRPCALASRSTFLS